MLGGTQHSGEDKVQHTVGGRLVQKTGRALPWGEGDRGFALCWRLSLRAARQSPPGSHFISGVPWAAPGAAKDEQMFALLPPRCARLAGEDGWRFAEITGMCCHSKRREMILTCREEQELLTHRLVI